MGKVQEVLYIDGIIQRQIFIANASFTKFCVDGSKNKEKMLICYVQKPKFCQIFIY
jgi:hypothetical protein